MNKLVIGLSILGFACGATLTAEVARADTRFCDGIRDSTTAIARARDHGKTEDQVYALNARYFRTAAGARERPGTHELLDDLVHALYTDPDLLAETPERTGALFYASCVNHGY